MKIAAYVDKAGAITSFYEDGVVRIYDNASESWQEAGTILFDATLGMSLAQVKLAIRLMVAQLRDCKVFLSAEVRGLVNSVLQEEHGFHTWKSQGSLLEQLDTVAASEVVYAAQKAREAAEEAARPKIPVSGCCGGGGGGRGFMKHKNMPKAELVSDGYYRFDLARVLKADPNLNSRLALVPVMEEVVEEKPFNRLEILCDHLPRWFPQKLADLNLKAEIESFDFGVRATVSRKPALAIVGKDA